MAQAHSQSLQATRLISQRRRLWRTFTRNRTAVVGLVLVALIVLIAVAAPLLAPFDPLTQETTRRLSPPTTLHWFGRDDLGRDILSRVIYGTRVSLLVGVLSVLLGGVLGTSLGLTAGYAGGKVEIGIMRLIDILLAFPDLITGMLVAAVLGPGLVKLIIAIGLTITPRFARLSHGPTLTVKERDFVSAARALGAGSGRILRLHILPNILGELLVLASLWTASAIRLEASLSFIGLGVSPPTPTWGQMIRDGVVYLTKSPWYSLLPGLALLVTVLGFNLLGDGLRDILDPRSQS